MSKESLPINKVLHIFTQNFQSVSLCLHSKTRRNNNCNNYGSSSEDKDQNKASNSDGKKLPDIKQEDAINKNV